MFETVLVLVGLAILILSRVSSEGKPQISAIASHQNELELSVVWSPRPYRSK